MKIPPLGMEQLVHMTCISWFPYIEYLGERCTPRSQDGDGGPGRLLRDEATKNRLRNHAVTRPMKARIGICNDIDGIAWAVQSCKSLDEGKGDKSDASIVKRASINPTATTVQSWNSGPKQRTNDRCHLPLPPRHGITGLVASESQRSSLTRRRLPGVTRLLTESIRNIAKHCPSDLPSRTPDNTVDVDIN